MKNIIGIIVSYIFIIAVIILAKFFKKYGEEASRKFIHIVLSNWWFIAMYFYSNAFWASLVPISFVIINYISYKKNIISVMEREEQEGLGTVYYAISLLIIVILTFGITQKTQIGLCSILIMGYGDGLASIIGKAIRSYEYKIGNTKKDISRNTNNVHSNIYNTINTFICNKSKFMVNKNYNHINSSYNNRGNINKRNRQFKCTNSNMFNVTMCLII